jgi:hypothetical protein
MVWLARLAIARQANALCGLAESFYFESHCV